MLSILSLYQAQYGEKFGLDFFKRETMSTEKNGKYINSFFALKLTAFGNVYERIGDG